jgi:hypothetical protein
MFSLSYDILIKVELLGLYAFSNVDMTAAFCDTITAKHFEAMI